MSELINKSQQNFNAISILEAGKLFSPVIHCAYYSSLQLIVYYIYEYINDDREALQNEVHLSKSSSHSVYFSKIAKEISKHNRLLSTEFYKKMTNFRQKRNDADYLEIIITHEEAKKAKKIASEVNNCLKSFFEDGKVNEVCF